MLSHKFPSMRKDEVLQCEKFTTLAILWQLQNVHADGTGFEREQGYLYPHNFPHAWVRQQYLPDEIKDRRYYEYGDNKTEQAAKRYWDEIKK